MADWLRELSVGEWYRVGNAAGSEPFEIVSVDIENEVVLVQHFDSTLEEFDFDAWMELGAKPAAPPEDWTGAIDVDKPDKIPDNDLTGPGRWEDPLDLLDQRYS
jgi:hypothetical protein